MEYLQMLCHQISKAFREQNIDLGYTLIMEFSDCIDEENQLNNIQQDIKIALQLNLIELQILLDTYDDIGVAEIFETKLLDLASNITMILN